MERIFVIGDIHGCSATLKELILNKIQIQKSDTIYFVGDYIDRGNDSKGVIDFILNLKEQNYNIHTLRGNHEQMLLDSENSNDTFHHWMVNGGDKTLKSFNIESAYQLKPYYWSFFAQTQFFINTKDFFIVHAGLNFKIQNPIEDTNSMLWIRDNQVNDNYLNKKILIHGHTPQSRKFILSQKFESPINIDGGCVYKTKKGLGSLFALNFYEKKFIETENID
ncbi:MAG: metallophosphoesterase family protein [Bacteroidales bacterium]|nr:metallophosphoesterase family protein [Bacteroidales bacterium]